MTRRLLALVLLLSAAGLFAQRGGPASAPVVDAVQARAVTGAAKLYDTSVLHRIDIVIPREHVDKIVRRTTERVPCAFTIDGMTLKNVGVRQAGGVYHPYQPITNKPSLSLKFDEFTKKQRLFDLDKLILKNELQDTSLVNEHLTYEVFRLAGLAAPMTAHARVTINGIDSGIYLMREPIDQSFLVRNFGGNFAGGNLYEIENVREFVFDPGYPVLDDEGKDGRTRDDLVRFAAAIASTSADRFVADLSPRLDIDRFITYVAAEIATLHWDGLTYRNNNTYIYAHPKDGRFIFIPYGADQGFGGGWRIFGPQPESYLVRKLMAAPALAKRLNDEVERLSREPIWNQRVLLDRVERAAKILATADTTGRTASDVARFAGSRPNIESFIRSGGPAR